MFLLFPVFIPSFLLLFLLQTLDKLFEAITDKDYLDYYLYMLAVIGEMNEFRKDFVRKVSEFIFQRVKLSMEIITVSFSIQSLCKTGHSGLAILVCLFLWTKFGIGQQKSIFLQHKTTIFNKILMIYSLKKMSL